LYWGIVHKEDLEDITMERLHAQQDWVDVQTNEEVKETLEQLEQEITKKHLKQLVERILNYLITNYQETINMNRLCRQFSISRSYMYRIFKQYTGTSMNEFLVAYRINKAKELLQNTADPITEIAISIGFNDISHFCHTFKSRAGATPSQYRSKIGRLFQ
jgi:AraC-like DNA-binding protein